MKLAALLLFSTISHAASITQYTYCSDAHQQSALDFSCSSVSSSASTTIGNGAKPDLRVDVWAANPSIAAAGLYYDAVFDITVSGSGAGFLFPIMVVSGAPDPALTAEANLTLGSFHWAIPNYNSGIQYSTAIGYPCYGCGIAVTFGQATRMELKMDVYARAFFQFAPNWKQASSYAEASLQDFWVFQDGQRVQNSVTLSEVWMAHALEGYTQSPEPGYRLPLAGILGACLIVRRMWKR